MVHDPNEDLMSNMHPVRVKTSAGWQDLVLPGPQGPPGATGPQGPQGPQGPPGTGGGGTTGNIDGGGV
jgi:hypothetical protein